MCVRILSTSQTVGKLLSHSHGSSVEFCEATPIGLVDESKDPCTDVRRTETCVAPTSMWMRHVIFIFIFSERAAWGGGGCAARLSLMYSTRFPVQQTTNGIGHRVK